MGSKMCGHRDGRLNDPCVAWREAHRRSGARAGSWGMSWSFQEQKLPHPIMTFLSQVVQSPSCVWLFATAARQTSLSLTIFQILPKFMTITLVMPSNHLILFSFCLLSFPSSESFPMSQLITWPKYWSFSINLSKEHLGLIIFKIDWFHLLAFQGTLKSLLQHHSLKASILWYSAFFILQILHPCMTTRKTT